MIFHIGLAIREHVFHFLIHFHSVLNLVKFLSFHQHLQMRFTNIAVRNAQTVHTTQYTALKFLTTYTI